MSVKAVKNTHNGTIDKAKWLFAWLSFALAVVLSVVGAKTSEILRVGACLGASALGIFCALSTEKGKAFMNFARESRAEVRKVVWPNKQEMSQTTIGVFVVVFVAALLLWLIDTGLLALISHFMRPRGRTMTSEEQKPLSGDGKQWFVIQAYSGFESHVKKMLEERIRHQGLQDKFGDILVPTEEVVEMRGGKKRKSERKFFPGYVLVRMLLDDETWHLVRKTPKVLGFIGGTKETPAPISDAEADNILHRVEEGVAKPRPKVLFEVGEVIRVNDGPFADFNGVVEEVNYDKSRLRVAVLIFGRSTPVELEFSQVEKA